MNANDSLKHYNCSGNFYKHLFGYIFTDGVKALADDYECFWFIDIVVSYQSKLKDEDFQVWKLTREDDTSVGKVVCTDGDDRVLASQDIPFTDFKANEATLRVEGNVILLPSEH